MSGLNTNFNQPPSYSNNKSLNHKSLSLVFFVKHNPHKTRAPDMLFTSSEYVIINGEDELANSFEVQYFSVDTKLSFVIMTNNLLRKAICHFSIDHG